MDLNGRLAESKKKNSSACGATASKATRGAEALFKHIHIYIYIYIYIEREREMYTYVYIYIYIHIYTYTAPQVPLGSWALGQKRVPIFGTG